MSARSDLTVTTSDHGLLIENLTSHDVTYRGFRFPPGSRYLDYKTHISWTAVELPDGLDETQTILNHNPNAPRQGGWFWPWGEPYGGVTGGTGIRHLVTADSQKELKAMQQKFERVVARHPVRGIATEVFGYKRFDDQHIRRFTGPAQAMAEQGCTLAQKLLVDEAWAAVNDPDNDNNLTYIENFAAKHPHRGVKMGRAHGHRLVLLELGNRYASGHQAQVLRNNAATLFETMKNAVTRWGTVQRNTNDFYTGHPVVGFEQAYERCILLWGVWAWRRQWWGLPGYKDLLKRMTCGAMDSELWGLAGIPGLVKNNQVGDDDPKTAASIGPLHSAKIEVAHTDDLYAIAYWMSENSSKYLRMGMEVPRSAAGNGAFWRKATQEARTGGGSREAQDPSTRA